MIALVAGLFMRGRMGGDYPMTTYEQLATVLAKDGIKCRFQAPEQLVVSAQIGPAWPDCGNSFWITRAENTWHLFTWLPAGYLVPDTTDIASLCRECMAHSASAMYRVPTDVAQQFGLRELSEDEVDAVFAKLPEPA
jgi:hypothetical protein